MTRIPKIRCLKTGKVVYRSEVAAREALPRVLDGAWKHESHVLDFALGVFKCGRHFHLGHSRRAIEAFAKKAGA